MSLCDLGKHKWIYRDFQSVKTSVYYDGNYNGDFSEQMPNTKKCLRCGRIDKVVDWKHGLFGKLRIKWRRVR